MCYQLGTNQKQTVSINQSESFFPSTICLEDSDHHHKSVCLLANQNNQELANENHVFLKFQPLGVAIDTEFRDSVLEETKLNFDLFWLW